MRKKGCCFCGKPVKEVKHLVEGTELYGESMPVWICLPCTKICAEQLQQEFAKQRISSHSLTELPTPAQINKALCDHIVGQKRALRRVAVETSHHYQRIFDMEQIAAAKAGAATIIQDPALQMVEISKGNILMVGPTGVGKTEIARSLAKTLNVPFAIGDATVLTEAGYVGEDVENLLLKLLIAADYDIEAAQRGIVYIDEIDKLRKTGGNVSITRDVSGEGVQQSLLKLIEGTISNVPPQGGRKHPEQQYIQIDTTNILFICGGSFVGLEDIIRRRLNKRCIGFGNDRGAPDERQQYNELIAQVCEDDLIEFGLIPELVGRLPVIASLDKLAVEDLMLILTEPKNALLLQERKKFAYYGGELEFTDDAVREIAEMAEKKGTGGRALRSVLSELMTDIYFEIKPGLVKGKSFIIDRDVVRRERGFYEPPKSAAA